MELLPKSALIFLVTLSSISTGERTIFSQTPKQAPTGSDSTKPILLVTVEDVIERANDHFRKGKLLLEAKKRTEARDEFDKAIDSVLMSGFDVRENGKLKDFYLELVERIYREEPLISLPSSQAAPQIGFRDQSTDVRDRRADSRVSGEPNRDLRRRRIDLPPKYPIGYAADDPASAYVTLAARKTQFAKGTFETTAEFRERLRKIVVETKIGGKRAVSDVFTFITRDFTTAYDADTASVTLRLSFARRGKIAYGIADELLDSFDRPESRKRSGAYDSYLARQFGSVDLLWTSKTIGRRVGRNAFGVKIPYVIRQYTSLRLAMRDTGLYSYGQEIAIHAEPSVAKGLIGNLRVAFVGRLRFPFTHVETDFENATINNHEESHYTHYYLFFDPDAIVIFNSQTGGIVGVLELPVEDEMKRVETTRPTP